LLETGVCDLGPGGFGREGIVRAPRDDAANATPRIVDVVLVARDEMNVKMKHRLAGGGTDVDADIETRRVVLGSYRFSCDSESG
jgi:hypothetical protein